MNRFLTCLLGLACLAHPGYTFAAGAASTTSSESIDFSFYSHDPVLVRGDADLRSSRYNPCVFDIVIEHEIVNDRQIVCTVHSSIEETRWGNTKFRFPARSYVLYTAPSGTYVTGFRFHGSEQFTGYSAHLDDYEHYRMNGWNSMAASMVGPREHWVYIRSDGWGDDYGMWWRYYGQLEVATADIDYSHLQYQGSHVSPGFGGFNPAHGPFGF